MKRLRELAWIVGFMFLVLPSIVSKLEAQAFPVLLVDTAVRNRLAEEWEPTNRYQHERGYCVRYTEGYVFSWSGPVIVYELTGYFEGVGGEHYP